MLMNLHRIRPAAMVFFLCCLGLIGVGILLARETPLRAVQGIDAIRVGVDEPVDCHDPASCMVSHTLGQARIPAQEIACRSGGATGERLCRLELAGKPLQVVVQFDGADQTRILECLGASYDGVEIACQAIYHYPVSEVALMGPSSIPAAEIQQLRWRYPLTQLSSADWWLVTLGLALLVVGALGCGVWLISKRASRVGRISLTVSSGLVGMCLAGIVIVVLLANLHFPID